MEMAHSASLIPCQGKKVNWKFIHIIALEARSNLCTDYVTQTPINHIHNSNIAFKARRLNSIQIM